MGLVCDPWKPIDRFIARRRLRHGFCPRCNCDAPAVDSCVVCRNAQEEGQYSAVPRLRCYYPIPSLVNQAYWWYCFMHPGMKRLQEEADRKHAERVHPMPTSQKRVQKQAEDAQEQDQ